MADIEDTIKIELQEGRYQAHIMRGNNHINSLRTPDFYEILVCLGDYHFSGIHNTFHGDISPIEKERRGEYRNPQFLKWKLQLQCELPEPQKKALEHMILMHNHVVLCESKENAL